MTDEQKQEVEAINKKYDEAEKKLTEKAEKEAYDIAGFLAYDISLVDADGNKVEPNGDVKVTMDYKQPVIADISRNFFIKINNVFAHHLAECNSFKKRKLVKDKVNVLF